ncbi:MAG: hypothetical protein B6242_07180 [Anaerolineaceae bacterium 4572_78]|nr:MAG: hypothetical protein B6242_07180 [Anaerolineaceae bacterium 4572_78]
MSNQFKKFTRDSHKVLAIAKRIAKTYNQNIITPNHLLFGVLELADCQAEKILLEFRFNLANLKQRLIAYIKLDAKGNQDDISIGHATWRDKYALDTTEIINQANSESEENNLNFVDTRLIVLGMLRQRHNSAAELLEQNGVTLDAFREKAKLHDTPPVNVPRFQLPDLSQLKKSPFMISPTFIILVLFTLVFAYLTYAHIGNSGVTTFCFVTGAWVVSVALHEFGHALAAFWGGDESVAHKGYLTLDPLKYTHPVLSIILPILFLAIGGIPLPGGAVFINHNAIRSRLMKSITSAAGPFATFLCIIVLLIPFMFGWYETTLESHNEFWAGISFLVFIEIFVLFLNLLPLPGLDGFGILEPFLPETIIQQANIIRPYTIFVLVALFFYTGFADGFFLASGFIMRLVNQDLIYLLQNGLELYWFWK